MNSATAASSVLVCSGCRTELAPTILACPACNALVHRDELTRLASEAERAARDGNHADALATWRRALELLPPRSRQHAQVTTRVRDLSRDLETKGQTPPAPAPETSKKLGRVGGVVGMVGLLLWKLKFVLGFVITKGKVLLLGLTKLSTLTTMLLSLGVYWAAFGYAFALGLVVSIYVHEMGHVAALRRYGISAGAPMFIPGLGALVRMKQYPVEPREDARVGLAGPLWGLGAALVAYAVGRVTGWSSWLAIARVGAWINLFNLVPIWQLDGGRGFRALTKPQRIVAAVVIAAAWFLTSEGILLLLLAGAVFRIFQKEVPTEPDRRALIEYTALVAALSALAMIDVPGMGVLP